MKPKPYADVPRCSLEIEAENIDEAREIAQETDGGEFHSDEYGDWNIDDIIELNKEEA